jgi:hypothetical protein
VYSAREFLQPGRRIMIPKVVDSVSSISPAILLDCIPDFRETCCRDPIVDIGEHTSFSGQGARTNPPRNNKAASLSTKQAAQQQIPRSNNHDLPRIKLLILITRYDTAAYTSIAIIFTSNC